MTTSSTIHDVLIIGGGPTGLAVAARLRENTPSAVFSDAEHSRYHWVKKHAERTNIYRPKAHQAKGAKHTSRPRFDSSGNQSKKFNDEDLDIKVLDSSGSTWMHAWKHNFAALRISHLRSPMFFHPCPADRDGLLAFAHETGRSDNCLEIGGCVGKSLSKHRRKKKIARGHGVGKESAGVPLEIDERDRKDYYTPSAELFHDYCDCIVDRYELGHIIEHKKVASIEYDFFDTSDSESEDLPQESRVFKVTTACGGVMLAKTVVLAIGSGGTPIMPRPLSATKQEGACHTSQICKHEFLPCSVKQKIRTRKATAVMVVGGGLTSAQIAVNCLEAGVTRVFLVMRSNLSLKPFNIDLAWVAKYRNGEKASFWSADSDEERYEMLRKARGGGSITPRFYKKLEAWASKGALTIHQNTMIEHQHWSPISQTWTIETNPPIADLVRPVDYFYYGTGMSTDIESLPMLSSIREEYPIETMHGLPCLTNDLAWRDDVPLFLTGRLAGLRVGPDCETLEGARLGAERISWSVQDILEREGNQKTREGENGGSHQEICQQVGVGNMYAFLDAVEEQ